MLQCRYTHSLSNGKKVFVSFYIKIIYLNETNRAYNDGADFDQVTIHLNNIVPVSTVVDGSSGSSCSSSSPNE